MTEKYYKGNTTELRNPSHVLHPVNVEELTSDIQSVVLHVQAINDMNEKEFTPDVLSEVISQVRANCFQWIVTGMYAYKIKVHRLYKETHKTFEEFCNKALGLSHWMINGYIKAAQIWAKLVSAGFTVLPKNESQIRALSKLPDEELYCTWNKIVTEIPEHKISKTTIELAME